MRRRATSLLLALLAGALGAKALDRPSDPPRPSAPTAGHDHHRAQTAALVTSWRELSDVHSAVEAARRGTTRYRSVERAQADGYRQVTGVLAGSGAHFVSQRHVRRAGVDPARPEALLYDRGDAGGLELVGVAYLLRRRSAGDDPPTAFGSLARWHSHRYRAACLTARRHGPPITERSGQGRCRARGGVVIPPRFWMLHAWLYRRSPEGLFAELNSTVGQEAVIRGVVEPRAAGRECRGRMRFNRACWMGRYREMAHRSGPRAALARLRVELPRVRGLCHTLTHVIGRVAGDSERDLADAFAKGKHLCGTGYFHGVMEAAIERIGLGEGLRQAGLICARLAGPRRRSLYHQGCAHGLGHGFMGALRNDVPRSLRACDSLPERWEREHCYNGVFMENHDPTHSSRYLDPERPLYPCTAVAARYKGQCYQKQTAYVLRRQGNDFTGVFALCHGVGRRFRGSCYHGVGRSAFEVSLRLGLGVRTRARTATALCGRGRRYSARLHCLRGAVRYAVLYFGGRGPARAICKATRRSLRRRCLKAANAYYTRDFGAGTDLGRHEGPHLLGRSDR